MQSSNGALKTRAREPQSFASPDLYPLDTRPFRTGGRTPFVVSSLLAAVTVVTCAVLLLVPDILQGEAAMNGSVRGTALVLVLATIPVMIAAMRAAARGSVRAHVIWAGTIAHVLYQSLLFAYATPFDVLFLPYMAMLGLAVWAAITLVASLDVASLPGRFAAPWPRRSVAGFLGVVAVLNAFAWLGRVVPAFADAANPAFLEGSGLTTNPVFVQDLALFIPLMIVGAWWLWQQQAWGYLVVGAMLTSSVIEGITVAADQYIGHQADPTSTIVSSAAVPLFVGLAVLTAVPLALYLRALRIDR